MLSIILAVHNGADTLPRTLSGFCRVARPSQGMEIIAVENASTDNTREILDSYSARLPMTILYESRQGKSFALNTGIEHAKGDFLIFTDDDIIPEVNWLTAYVDAAKRHPDIGIFAGQVRHEWDVEPPHWLRYLADIGKSYGGTHMELKDQIVSYGIVKGCNLMVRRHALGDIRFAEDPKMNFTGEGASAGGEDTLFARQVAGSSNGVMFVPEACVRHIVREDEIGIKPVFSRYMRIGRTQPIEAKGGFTVSGYPVWGLRQAFTYAAKCLSWLMRCNSEEAAMYMVRLAATLGGLLEGHRRDSNKK